MMDQAENLRNIIKKQNLKNVNQTLLNRPLKSLDSYTSKQVLINVFAGTFL